MVNKFTECDTLSDLFAASNATLVALVTYQRTGSSFLGELFNQNPEAFVWFEPLDGVYSALYGTAYGYNVPSDLWNYPNGTERYTMCFISNMEMFWKWMFSFHR